MRQWWMAAVVFLAGVACGAPPERFEFQRLRMGTWFRLVIYADSSAEADGAATAAFARIDELNASLSDYIADSELNRLSESAGTGAALRVGNDLWEVLSRGRELAERSGGAFDITVGPLVRLWREARKAGVLPPEPRIRQALSTVGYDRLILDPASQTAALTTKGMRLDAGGIAKGYAADCAFAECVKRGLRRAMVAAAGDIVAGDPPPGQEGWRIGLPDAAGGPDPQECLLLAGAAVSSSGDQFQFVEVGGRRYSHLVDPHTGIGVTHGCTVTVVVTDAGRNGMTADALASGACVLGPERGLELIERTPGAAARIVRPSGGGALTSKAFSRWRIVPR